MAFPETITLNGISYVVADLHEAARSNVQNIQVVEAEILRLQQQMGIAQTARNDYVAALSTAIGAPAPVPAATAATVQ